MKIYNTMYNIALLILLAIMFVYGPNIFIVGCIIIVIGTKFVANYMFSKKESYEEEIKKLEAKRDELLDKSNHNYLIIKKQLQKFEFIIETESSYYEAQKVYFYINQAINNENLIMERERYLELVETFKKLEKKMLKLPLKR